MNIYLHCNYTQNCQHSVKNNGGIYLKHPPPFVTLYKSCREEFQAKFFMSLWSRNSVSNDIKKVEKPYYISVIFFKRKLIFF